MLMTMRAGRRWSYQMADADYLEQKITEHPAEMMSSRMWTNVCFRFTTEDAVDLNTRTPKSETD